MKMGDTVVIDMPRDAAVRKWVLNHTIHHRAQLTVYRAKMAFRCLRCTAHQRTRVGSGASAPSTFCGGGVVRRRVARAVLVRWMMGLIPALSPEGSAFLQKRIGPDRSPLPACFAAMCDHVRVGEILHTPTLWLFTHRLCSPTHHAGSSRLRMVTVFSDALQTSPLGRWWLARGARARETRVQRLR